MDLRTAMMRSGGAVNYFILRVQADQVGEPSMATVVKSNQIR